MPEHKMKHSRGAESSPALESFPRTSYARIKVKIVLGCLSQCKIYGACMTHVAMLLISLTFTVHPQSPIRPTLSGRFTRTSAPLQLFPPLPNLDRFNSNR